MKVLIFFLLLSVFLTPVTAKPCIPTEGGNLGCLNCDEQQPWMCDMCDAGYYLYVDEGAYCKVCTAGTGKAADQVPQISQTTCDVTCDPICKVCGAEPGKCLQCKPGYFRTAKTNTCTLCEGGKGSDDRTNRDIGVDTECSITCPPGCNNCVSTSECVSCKAGFYFNQATKLCSLCPDGNGRGADDTGFLTASTTCDVTCAEGCSRCGSAPDKCMACKAGYQYSAEMGTCTLCPAGTTAPASDVDLGISTTCSIPCDPKCSICLGTSTFCLGCAAGYSFNVQTHACTQCESGKGRAADATSQTDNTICDVNCQLPCLFCGATATTCLGCDTHNEFNLASHSCTTCPAGVTRVADTAIQTKDAVCDVACKLGCKFCLGAFDNCRGCYGGWSFFDNGSRCTACTAQSPEANTPAPGGTFQDTFCTGGCDTSCKTCGNTSTDCRSCQAGKRLDWDTKTCVDCPIGYTKAADAQSQVAGTTCDIKCPEGCAFCDSASTDCFGCLAGFSFDLDAKTCTSCALGSGRAADATPPIASTTCEVPCSLDCTICGGTATECIGCPQGHRLVAALKTCIRCSGGSGRALDLTAQVADTTCSVECNLGCDSCTDTPGECLTCDQAFYKKADGTCERCPVGRGKPRDTDNAAGTNDTALGCPVECHASCLNCKGPGADECVGCKGPYRELTQYGFGRCELCGGKQYGLNPPNWTKRPYDVECSKSCDTTCDSCSDLGDDKCLTCPIAHYWNAGKCLICPLTTGKPKDSELQTTNRDTSACDTCHTSCLRCKGTSATDCVQCGAGYKLMDTGACVKCEAGKTKDADTAIVQTSTCGINCNARCTVCTGSNLMDCVTCKNGFYMETGEGCSLCPVGKGKLNDPDIPTLPGDSSSCDIVCHPSCSACRGPDANQCTACRGGYFWAGGGECIPCFRGTGTSDGEANMEGLEGERSLVCTTTCHASCQICHGADNADACTLCAAGYYMTAAGRCEGCPLGKGKRADSETSIGVEACDITCNPECATCYETGEAQCLGCRAGKFLTEDNNCDVCEAGNTRFYIIDWQNLLAKNQEKERLTTSIH